MRGQQGVEVVGRQLQRGERGGGADGVAPCAVADQRPLAEAVAGAQDRHRHRPILHRVVHDARPARVDDVEGVPRVAAPDDRLSELEHDHRESGRQDLEIGGWK